MDSPVSLIDRFKTDYGVLGEGMVGLLIVSGLALLVGVGLRLKKALPALGACMLVFFISVLPVLFLPTHKFTIQLSLAAMSLAVFVAFLLESFPRWVRYMAIGLFLLLNVSSIVLTAHSHYTVQRAEISKKVFAYMQEHHSTLPADSYFFIANSDTPGSDIATWGSSHQVKNALMGSNFFEVFYKQDRIEVYFEDDQPQIEPSERQRIELKSEWFL